VVAGSSSVGVEDAVGGFVGVGAIVGVAGTGSLTGVGSVGATGSGLAGKPGAFPVGVAYTPHRDGGVLQAPRRRAKVVRTTRLRFTM